MKGKKYLALIAALMMMVGCNQNQGGGTFQRVCEEEFSYASLNGVTRKDSYTTYLSYMPTTLDYTKTMQSENAQHIANFVDGLVEHDRFGNLIPCLATNTGTPSDNYKTWSFTIDSSKAAQWVTKDGAPYQGNGRTSALVQAKDFKDTLRLVLNAATASESAYLPMLIIEGAEQYNFATSASQTYKGDLDKILSALKGGKDSMGNFFLGRTATVADVEDILAFNRVGVDVEGNTITYHLTNSADYFPTMLTYLPFLPICMEYYEEVGSSFGSKDNLLFNGAYLLDQRTDMVISYKKNETYWDKDKVKTPKVVYNLLPSTLGYDFARDQYELGNIDSFGVNSFDEEGWAKYVLGEDGHGTILDPHNDLTYSQESTSVDSSFFFYLNLNRKESANTLSDMTASEIQNANRAFKYSYIRDAIFSALDLEAYNARNGIEQIEQQQTQLNTYIPKNFVTDNNGKDYFEYLLDAYQARHEGASREDAEKALNPGQVNQISLEDSVAKTAAAVEQLAKDDPKVTYPIVVEYTSFYGDDEQRYYDDLFIEYTNRRLNGCVINTDYKDEKGLKVCNENDIKIRLQPNTKIQTSQNYITVSNTYDYSLFISGWGPDYGDPMTYAHTLVIGGDMAVHFGTQTASRLSDETKALLTTYGEMVTAANQIVSTTQEQKAKRYKGFAEAELFMLEECALIKPLYQPGQGYSCTISKFVPYRSPRAGYGLSSNKLKGLEILNEPLTACQRQRLKAEWEQEKAQQK